MTDGNGSGTGGNETGAARTGGSGGATPGPASDVQWYIARDGQQHGPLTDVEMRLFVDGGHLKPTDLLWRPGFSDWRPAPQVFPPRPTEPAPPPPPPQQPAAPRPAAAAPAQQAQPASDMGARTAAATSSAQQGGYAHASPAGASRAAASADPRMQPAAAAGGPSAAPGSAGQASRYGQPRTGGGPASGPGHATGSGPAPGPTMGPATGQAGTGRSAAAPAASSSRALTTTAEQDDFDYQPEKPRRGGLKAAVIALLLIGVVGGGGWFFMQYKASLLALLGSGSTAKDGVPVVKAERDPVKAKTPTVKTAATAPVGAQGDPSLVAAPTLPPPDTAALDAALQRRPLWVFMKSTFPDWYGERVKEAAVMVAASRPTREVTKHLIEALVDYRRKNADLALKASTGRHKAIANAFLENLQSLSARGPDVCYGFISQGETSSMIVDLMATPESSPSVEKHAISIFEAVAEGKTQPVGHDRPRKEDYDVLASQLGKLGWSQADLQMFADPKSLSAATPTRVCQMVRDWFKAHVEITDTAVQERLLFETLRPVIGG